MKQYFLKGGFWLLLARLLTALTGLILSAILARILSPDDLGVFFLAFNLAAFFAIVSRFGMENTLLRFVPEALAQRRYQRARNLINKGLILVGIISLLVGLLFYLFAGVAIAGLVSGSAALMPVLGLVAVWFIVLAFQALLGEIFRAFQLIRESVFFGGLLTMLVATSVLCLLWMVAPDAGLNLVLYSVVAAACLSLMCGFACLKAKMGELPYDAARSDISDFSEMLGNAWPLMLHAILLFGLSQSGLFVLAMFRPEDEVAVYGAAARVAVLLSMAFTVVNGVVMPLIPKYNGSGMIRKLEKILRLTAICAAIPALPVLLVFVAFGGELLSLLFGEYYVRGAEILAILGFAQGVVVACGACGYVLMLTGHRLILLLITTVWVTAGVGLSVALAPQHGGNGVALATSLAIAGQQFSMLIAVRIRLGIWTFADPWVLVHEIRSMLASSRLGRNNWGTS